MRVLANEVGRASIYRAHSVFDREKELTGPLPSADQPVFFPVDKLRARGFYHVWGFDQDNDHDKKSLTDR